MRSTPPGLFRSATVPSIGLIVTVAEYFSGLIKISYEKLVVITTIIGFVFAMFGVNKIVLEGKPAKKFDPPSENIIQKYVSIRSGLLLPVFLLELFY